MGPLAPRLLTGLAAVILSLGAAELAVRSLGLAPSIAPIEIDTPYGPFVSAPDPRLVYVPKPGFGDISAYGIRDRQRDTAKPDGTYRIVVLGDSVAFGLCSYQRGTLALEDLFSTRLERALNDLQAGFEVWNLAVSGYNTVQETIFFEQKGPALSPDLAIVAYVLNDHLERTAELRQFERNPEFARVQSLTAAMRRNALLRSALVRAVWVRAGAVATPTAPRLRYAAQVSADLAPLRALAEAHRFDVIVAIFPSLGQQKDGVYEPAGRHAIVAEAARRHGFDVLDLLPGFLAAGNGDLQALRGRCTGMHPDERGHEVAAQLLFDHFAESRGLH